MILHKYYEQQVIRNLWTDKKYVLEFQGTNLLKQLLGKNLFSYPKSALCRSGHPQDNDSEGMISLWISLQGAAQLPMLYLN